jgi:hypothetical protein
MYFTFIPASPIIPFPSDAGAIKPPAAADGSPAACSEDDDVLRCKVCNDYASGFHYGIYACEGCKASYIQRKKDIYFFHF